LRWQHNRFALTNHNHGSRTATAPMIRQRHHLVGLTPRIKPGKLRDVAGAYPSQLNRRVCRNVTLKYYFFHLYTSTLWLLCQYATASV
jgi:hypothetical protein